MIGKTVSHYRIEEKIGAGGMGEIYLAQDTRLNRRVALKFLPESLVADPESRERLLREAQAVSRLSHPNILTVFAVEHAEGRDFIAMEYIAGATLGRAAEQKNWSIDDLIEIAIQIADGLRSAHEAEVVHRDLKPSNILIDREGRARILDFGIAKVKGASKLTKTGSTMGTVSYLSPEQAQGKDVDARSDLFSFGAILYELISGQLPFGGDHEAAIVYAIANEEPEPLARFKKNVPDELQRIVTKCLAKDPRERYQSATDLVADLRTLRRRQTTGTIPPVPARKSSRTLIYVAAAAVILIAAGLWLLPFMNPQPKQATARDTIMLAVLPFQNLGSPDDEYFASGVNEEILTDLAQVPGLGVISRTSTMKYKDHTKSIKEIADELGVDYVLEASIQWDKSGPNSRVRLHPQLIRAKDDVHVWAGKFDAVLDDIFKVQSSIAAQVAENLSLALLPGKEDVEADRPTENAKAYELYLQARGYASSDMQDRRGMQKAKELFEQAIRLDSGFALAHAGLSKTMSQMNFALGDPEYARRAKAEAEKALELSPNLPQGLIALGQYYNLSEQQYDKALESFSRVEFTGVDESEVLRQMGIVRMRQGDWTTALQNFEEAFKHDPLSAESVRLLVLINSMMRRTDDVVLYMDRLISINPKDPMPYGLKALIYLTDRDDREGAIKIIRDAAAFVDPRDIVAGGGSQLWTFGLTSDTPRDLIKYIRDATRPPQDTVSHYLQLCALYRAAGDTAVARDAADSARLTVQTRLDQITSAGGGQSEVTVVAELYGMLGLSYALLGDKVKSTELGELAMQTLPVDLCHW